MDLLKNIRLIAILNFFTDFRLYAGIVIIYFAQITHSYALALMILAIANLSAAFFQIPTGIFSDRIGRRKSVILGALFGVIFTVFFAIGHSFWILAIGAMIQGLSISFYSGNNEALLYESLHQSGRHEDYHEFLGKTSSVFQVALGISVILGGVISQYSFFYTMWLSVIPQVICVLVATKLLEPTLHEKENIPVSVHLKEAVFYLLHNWKLRGLSLANMIDYGVGESAFNFQAAFYNQFWPIWAIGLAKAFSFASASLSFFYSGKLIKKFEALRLLLFGNLSTRTIGIISTLFPSFISPALMSSTSMFYGVSQVAQGTLMQKEFTEKQRATMHSINSFMGGIFYAVFAFVLGSIADRWGPAIALFAAQICMLPMILLYWFIYHREKKQLR